MKKVGRKLIKPRQLKQQLSGFTLIELAVTIIILGIMSATVIPRFFTSNGFEEYAYRTETIATLRAIQLRAMQQIDVDPTPCHIVLVTQYKLGIPDDCDGTPSFTDDWEPLNVGVNIESDNASFDVSLGDYFFSFDQMGRPVDCPADCDITIVGAENLSIRIESEGYIHAI